MSNRCRVDIESISMSLATAQEHSATVLPPTQGRCVSKGVSIKPYRQARQETNKIQTSHPSNDHVLFRPTAVILTVPGQDHNLVLKPRHRRTRKHYQRMLLPSISPSPSASVAFSFFLFQSEVSDSSVAMQIVSEPVICVLIGRFLHGRLWAREHSGS